MKALFPSREGRFSFRWIRKILAIRRRACVPLRRGISGSYIDDQSLMPRYGSRALGRKGREGQNLSTFVWVLIHPWRWLAWASVVEKPLSVSPIVGLQSCRATSSTHRAPPFCRNPPPASPSPLGVSPIHYIYGVSRCRSAALLPRKRNDNQWTIRPQRPISAAVR